MTMSRQVRRRFERTGDLPPGWSLTPVGEPTFHSENGDVIDAEVRTTAVANVVKRLVSSGVVFLALAGCASPAPVRFETPLAERIPASLLTCRDRPVSGDLDRQSDVARWVVELDSAGADCRSKVRAMKDVVEGDAVEVQP